MVGPQTVSFSNYVRLFKGKSKTKITNVKLEHAYHDAIHNSKTRYGIDDLNIMVGDFVGNHNKLKKLCNFEFKKFGQILKARSLSQ